MISVKVFNTKAKEVGDISLSSEIFDQPYNESLIHQVVVAQRANKRQGTKCTLTRREVRGGGIKPWRQKGTGRARQGSIRSPQWVGGGVVFAPKPRDFSKKINKQMKKNALKSALSAKIKDGDFIVLDDIKIKNAKTKEVAQILKNFSLSEKALLVLHDGKEDVKRASQNIPTLKTISANMVNVYDVVANRKLIVTKQAIKTIEEVNA